MQADDNKPSSANRRAGRITVRPDHKASSVSRQGESAVQGSVTDSALQRLTSQLEKLAIDIDKARLRDYIELLHKPWQLMWRNFIAGLFRGIGIALGFTFFAATIIWILQLLGKLNLPIVGDYIADIVRIVYRQLQINPY